MEKYIKFINGDLLDSKIQDITILLVTLILGAITIIISALKGRDKFSTLISIQKWISVLLISMFIIFHVMANIANYKHIGQISYWIIVYFLLFLVSSRAIPLWKQKLKNHSPEKEVIKLSISDSKAKQIVEYLLCDYNGKQEKEIIKIYSVLRDRI